MTTGEKYLTLLSPHFLPSSCMKKLLYSALCLVSAVAHAQTETFTVKGTTGSHAGITTAYLGHAVNQQWVVDSVAVKDGQFTFTGSLLEPVRATL
jgi:hypothetical protein